MITLLSAVQKVCLRLAQPKPASVFGSVDKGVLQFMALLEESLEKLSERGQWQELTKETTWVTTAAENQGLLSALCTENYRYMLPDTLWNRTDKIKLLGPLASFDWAALKAWTITGPLYQFRLRENKFLVNPAPTAGKTWAFEYVTDNWAETALGVGIKAFTLDTDLIRLPEQIVLNDLKWRWLEAKGMSYAQAFEDAESMIQNALGRTKPSKILDMANCTDEVRPGLMVSPGSWPL